MQRILNAASSLKNWATRGRSGRRVEWVIHRQEGGLLIRFGTEPAFFLEWRSESEQAAVRLLVVLQQAARLQRPARRAVSIVADASERLQIKAAIDKALGPGEWLVGNRSWSFVFNGLPKIGLAVLTLFVVVDTFFVVPTAPLNAPPSDLSRTQTATGDLSKTPAGWLEATLQKLAAGGLAETLTLRLSPVASPASPGLFQFSLQISQVNSARVMGGRAADAGAGSALATGKAILEQIPGQQSVALDESRSQLLLQFKPPVQPEVLAYSHDLVARRALSAGISWRNGERVTIPVQSLSLWLGSMPELPWRAIERLEVSRNASAAGLVDVEFSLSAAGTLN